MLRVIRKIKQGGIIESAGRWGQDTILNRRLKGLHIDCGLWAKDKGVKELATQVIGGRTFQVRANHMEMLQEILKKAFLGRKKITPNRNSDL